MLYPLRWNKTAKFTMGGLEFSDMLDRGYVLCRPDAGLNDILCQIEFMHRYATQSKRTLVVDTAYENSLYFKDHFSNYFNTSASNLILDIKEIAPYFDRMRTFPEEITGRVNSYLAWPSPEHQNFADHHTGTRLSFDASQVYEHQLLVHHSWGGGNLSLFALTKLNLVDPIVDALIDRIDTIGEPFSAIHIRNTDYKTDYIQCIQQIKDSILTPVFLATDDYECRNYCIDLLGSENVKYFSDLPEEDIPLHANHTFTDPYKRNVDAILDLLTLALSTCFYRIGIDGTLSGTATGYATLAENLTRHDGIVLSVLGINQKSIALFKKISEWRKSVPGTA